MAYKLSYLLIFAGVAIAVAVFSVAPSFATRVGISKDLASAYLALSVFVALSTLLTGYLYRASARVKELEGALARLGSPQPKTPPAHLLHMETGGSVLIVGGAMILGDFLVRITTINIETSFLTDFGVSVCAVGLSILLLGSWLERARQDKGLDSV